MINVALGFLISLLLLGFSPWSLSINQLIILLIICSIASLHFKIQFLDQLKIKNQLRQYCNIYLIIGLCVSAYLIQNQLLRYKSALSEIPSTQTINFEVIQIHEKSTRIKIIKTNNPKLQSYFIDYFWDAPNAPILGQTYQAELSLLPLANYVTPSKPTQIFYQASQGLIAYAKSSKNAQAIEKSLAEPNWINRQRAQLHRYLSDNYSESAAFLSALSIGITSNITQAEWQIYRNTGVTHLMAISGLHLSLVAGWCFVLFRFLAGICSSKGLQRIHPFQIAALAGCIAALFYALLAGFAIPIQRALIMWIIAMIFLSAKRNLLKFEVLACAFVGVILINPMSGFSPGFWLSFSVVFFLIWQQQLYKKLVMSNAKSSLIPQLLIIQLLLSIALMPLSLYFFSATSLISPLSNLLAIPMIILMVLPSLLIACIFWFCNLTLADYFFSFSQWSMLKLNDMLSLFSLIPHARFESKAINNLIVALVLTLIILYLFYQLTQIYLVIFASKFTNQMTDKSKKIRLLSFKIVIIISLFGGLYFNSFLLNYFKKLPLVAIYVLPVGEGLSIIIQLGQETFLFDTAGYHAQNIPVEKVILPTLKSLNITKLAGLILSQNDQQHIGGASTILQQNISEHIYTLPYLQAYIPQALDCSALKRHQAFISLQAFELQTSCAYHLTVGEKTIWILADISLAEWQMLLQNHPLPDIIIYPNQGRSNQYITREIPWIILSSSQVNQKLLTQFSSTQTILNAKNSTIEINFYHDDFEVIDWGKSPVWWR